MKFQNFSRLSLSALAVISLFSCSSDDDSSGGDNGGLTIPSTYTFANEAGESTISFGGQTTRLQQAEEILDLFEVFGTTEAALDEMFGGVTSTDSDGNVTTTSAGFTNEDLNGTTKVVRSKTAASDDYFSLNFTGANGIKLIFDGYIANQVAVFNSQYASKDLVDDASIGVAGKVTESDLETVRLINVDGYEYKQIFNKGLIGAFTLDQIVNNYLTRCLNVGNQEDNTNDVLEDGEVYTKLEHYWDEAYGYAYGNTGDDSFLYKYIGKVEGDVDFAGIQSDIETAFITGRAAIVANEYDVLEEQVEILQELLSEVIGIRAVYYLENGITALADNSKFGDACHDLSEGYGFIYSLQFTRKPGTEVPYVSAETVAGYIETLEAGNGLWDYQNDSTDLSTMSQAIADAFDFTVDEAKSTGAAVQ